MQKTYNSFICIIAVILEIAIFQKKFTNIKCAKEVQSNISVYIRHNFLVIL